MKKKRRRLNVKRLVIFIIFVVLVFSGIFYMGKKLFNKVENVIKKTEMYVASSRYTVPLYNLEYIEQDELVRGTKVIVSGDKILNNEQEYYKVSYEKNDYYIKASDLVLDSNEVVLEKDMYVKISATIYQDETSSKIESFVKRGNTVQVIGFDKLNEDGTVNMYKIKTSDAEGYVYPKYLSFDSNIEKSSYADYHTDRYFSYELYGGDANNLDYSEREKPIFADNVMPDEARTLYLTGSKWILADIGRYITLAKNNNINAFVVDIKDGYVAYESEVAKKYSNSNYKSYSNTVEEYKKAIDKLKENGFYVIGRIVAFNDSHFAKDNPSETISYSNGNTSWVSAYSRLAWEFNVELAKEAVNLFGFNEIQYDYVRFPEASYSYSVKNYNFKNKYNEDKAEAIQNFLMYATDEIHKLNVYVSADVFGECSGTYVTAYGQYWPAISNVVDVISAMPYPDHFAKGSYGLAVPWEHPYELMKGWGQSAANRQTEIPNPAKVRTWIQAYNSIYQPYIVYDASMVEAQIKGLFDSGLTGGYITWNGMASYDKYSSIASAFGKEY